MNSYWTEDDVLEKRLFDVLFYDDVRELGPLYNATKIVYAGEMGTGEDRPFARQDAAADRRGNACDIVLDGPQLAGVNPPLKGHQRQHQRRGSQKQSSLNPHVSLQHGVYAQGVRARK